MAFTVGELVDADAPQPLQAVDVLAGLLGDASDIRPTVRQATRSSSATATREVWTASHAAVSSTARVNQAPCRAHATAATTTHGRAANPGRVGLQEHPHHAKVKPTPAAPALTLVIARAAALTDRTAPPAAAGRPHHSDHRVGLLVEHDLLDHGVLDAQQPLPYSCGSHAAPPPGNPALSSRKPNGEAACSHARPAQTTHGSVTRAFNALVLTTIRCTSGRERNAVASMGGRDPR